MTPFLVLLVSLFQTIALAQTIGLTSADSDFCSGICSEDATTGKTCIFRFRVDLHASELGYFTVDGCKGTMPTLGVEKGVTYIFDQGDPSNYYHPLGLAYYPDGAHDNVDELEPGIPPPGSTSDCAENNMCPAPMYWLNDEYLGVYNNNAAIGGELIGDEDFGLDVYEPQFFLDFLTWKTAGTYKVSLLFDDEEFAQDLFYFCHIHQYMTGRIKIVNSTGEALYPDNVPDIPYEYETPSEYDNTCGTYGLADFTLPHAECPETFTCGKPDDGPVATYANCVDSMNCAMTVGMTSNVHMESAIALFNHQMIPHHQNAVNMCKALMFSGEIFCDDIEDEDNPNCVMTHLCYEIINGQNFQIQIMNGILDKLGYDRTDDCKVEVNNNKKNNMNNKKKKKITRRRIRRNKKQREEE